jgi:ABC-type glutathione transport system ATPase component
LCGNLRKRKKSIYGQLEEEDEEDPLVQIVNLQKTYGNNVFAVRGVSMALQKGEIVGLLG